jgi:hypothetical protein
MYVILGKEKPGIGSIRGLNLAAVRLVIIQMINCSLGVVT